ncbi:MAG TPA: CDP-diacylglycerol--serine O-phosphatidyltransferase [Candidatus Methanoperedens sp.]
MSGNIFKLIRPADVITLANALFGFASIIMVIRGDFDRALVFILAAVIADAADGAVARYSGCGVLGANLDSLSDVISFGVAPAAAAFVFLGDEVSYAGIFSGLFLVCGILRLARFNSSGKKDGFEGIPITSAGFIVALFLLARDYVPNVDIALILLLILTSFLMISTINYPKMKNPIILAPIAALLVLDIVVFYLGYNGALKLGALIILILNLAYVLSPIWRRFYDRSE